MLRVPPPKKCLEANQRAGADVYLWLEMQRHFSALMGEVLADLAEGATADADVATFGLSRFADGYPDSEHILGR